MLHTLLYDDDDSYKGAGSGSIYLLFKAVVNGFRITTHIVRRHGVLKEQW